MVQLNSLGCTQDAKGTWVCFLRKKMDFEKGWVSENVYPHMTKAEKANFMAEVGDNRCLTKLMLEWKKISSLTTHLWEAHPHQDPRYELSDCFHAKAKFKDGG
tara:strand:+ start:2022 stop:2330 length:309 start_codon:yes stop_codon:yes gene_type:complete